VVFQNAELDDLVIRRTDGSFTYNFSSVVDDVDMKITHIIRGTDHLNNTHRQIPIFRALGAEPPVFAHMPLTLGPDKTKLSKRHGDTALLAYRDKGFLPDAVVNYIVRLGWSHGDEEIFSIDELIKYFDLDGCNKSPGIFDMVKLMWVNEQHIQRKKSPEEIGRLLVPFLRKRGIEVSETDARLASIAHTLQTRAKTLVEMAASADFYFRMPESYDEKAAAKYLDKNALNVFDAIFAMLPDSVLDKEKAIAIVHEVAETLSVKLGGVAQPLRVALTGSAASPPIDEVMTILGPEEIRRRINKAKEFINKLS
jgi:glutamyl-tRNA synthetase